MFNVQFTLSHIWMWLTTTSCSVSYLLVAAVTTTIDCQFKWSRFSIITSIWFETLNLNSNSRKWEINRFSVDFDSYLYFDFDFMSGGTKQLRAIKINWVCRNVIGTLFWVDYWQVGFVLVLVERECGQSTWRWHFWFLTKITFCAVHFTKIRSKLKPTSQFSIFFNFTVFSLLTCCFFLILLLSIILLGLLIQVIMIFFIPFLIEIPGV